MMWVFYFVRTLFVIVAFMGLVAAFFVAALRQEE